MTTDRPPVPSEWLSPLAESVLDIIELHQYELSTAVEHIDDAVPGVGGLFDPSTSSSTLTDATNQILDSSDPESEPLIPEQITTESVVLYTDGSSRGNPGPAGAGAVLEDPDGKTLYRLGRPVGSRADNNTAEYAALHLGLSGVLSRGNASHVEIRIDSMTVLNDIRRQVTQEGFDGYRRAVTDQLAEIGDYEWHHVPDSARNPADSLATVGADIAGLGPGG